MTDTVNDIWHDRRVNIGYETAEELARKLNPANFRGHPESQADALDDSLDLLGWVGSVKLNINTNRIFDGELRIKRTLVKDPSIQIPVDYYDLTPDEELLALQVHDAITDQAEPIADKLAALLERTRGMTADRPGLGAMLERLRERAGINGHQKTEANPVSIDKAAELQKVWGTQVGQIWELGNHRLAVGDCTGRATVEAVMSGERAEACITDPPYGIGIVGKNNTAGNFPGTNAPRLLSKPIAGDDRPFDPSHLFGLAPKMVLWGANHYADKLPSSGKWLVWDKKDGAFAESDLGDCELAWTNLSGTSRLLHHTWQGMYRKGEGERAQRQHPTQKPVDLMAWCIEQCVIPEGGIVIDCYSGSGSTIMAAENLGRKVRAIELDPGYAAVSLQRFVDAGGQTPRRVSG